jgi:hypothetical protein
MRRLWRGGLVAVAVAAALLGGSGMRSEAAPCALTPVLLDTTINQGLQSYSQLVRGKETLVRFYFGLPSCAVSGNAVQVNLAQLTVKNQSATGTPALVDHRDAIAPVGTSTPPLITSTVKQIDATSDPKWVVSLVGPTTANFTASFEVMLKWQSKGCATCALSTETSTNYAIAPGTRSSLITKVVAARTNALRLLVVPMVLPPGGLTEVQRQSLQNALTVLSRSGPFSDSGGRLGDLAGATSPAGIRYTVNQGFIDLTPLLRPAPDGRFCGNNNNFAQIDSALALALQSFNSLNSTNPADKVVGVVPDSLSVPSAADATCFEGESSPGGIDSWVRLGSLGGAVFAQELAHNWGIEPFSRSNGAYHSIYTTAHAAAGDPGKTYNVLERAYVKSDGANATVNLDRTALINNINNGVTNSNVLLENADWNDAFCFLGGPIPTLTGSACNASRTVNGTAVGVAASAPGPAMQITAHTNGTVAGTQVVSTFVDDQLLTGQDTASKYHIVGRNASGGITIDFRAPASPLEGHSNEDVHVDDSTVLISSTVSRPSGTVKMELWAGTPPASYTGACRAALDATTVCLASTSKDGAAPTIADPDTDTGSGLPQLKPGASTNVTKVLDIAAIPKTYSKPNVYLLADTTGSMGGAIADVKSSASAIVNNFADKPGTDPCFGVGDYKDFLSGDAYAFRNALTFAGCSDSTQASSATTAINAWGASGGLDPPEAQLFALHRIAQGDAAYESDSQKLLIWFGDQPGHDPICGMVYAGDDAAPGITTNDVATELRNAGITVYPIGVTSDPNTFKALDAVPNAGYTNCPTGENAGLQATRIANATGGVVTLAPSNQVSETILKILNNQPATVVPSASCDTGLSIVFAPTTQTALTPTTMTFTETVTAAASAKPGTYTCHVSFTVNGTINHSYDQTLSYDVTTFTGAHTVVTWTADDDSTGPLGGTVALKCNGLFHILKANVLSDTSGDFVYDTTSRCPGGEIFVTVNDGWFVTEPVKAGDAAVPAGPPIVAISSPAAKSRILQFSDIALAGGGKYANGTPVAAGALSWKLDGNPVGTGETVDLRPPNGGWPLSPATHTLRLEGPEGSFDQVVLTFLGDNDNDGIATTEEPAINNCRPASLGGPVSDPDNFAYNATEDNDGDFLPNSSDAAPCTPETDYEATALFSPARFDVSKSPSFSLGGIFTPYLDLKLVPKSTVRISKVAGIPVSGPEWFATAWVVSGRFDGTVGVAGFSGPPLAAFINAHPALLNTTILVTVVGTTADGSRGFHADGQVYVFKSG